MDPWLWAVVVLQAGLLACGMISIRGKLNEAVVAMEMASLVGAISIALLAQGYGDPSYMDLALALSLMSFAGALLFLTYFERWR